MLDGAAVVVGPHGAGSSTHPCSRRSTAVGGARPNQPEAEKVTAAPPAVCRERYTLPTPDAPLAAPWQEDNLRAVCDAAGMR